MYWILQNNLFNEPKYQELVDNLKHSGIPYSEHKVVPFIGELIPDISPSNPVICIGSYSLRHLAKKKAWNPGVFDLTDICTFWTCIEQYDQEMLNRDAFRIEFQDVWKLENLFAEEFFIRPDADSKYFAGMSITRDELAEWRRKVIDLGEDDGTGLRSNTLIIISSLKAIQQEIRCWIFDKKVITSSIYKTGNLVRYSPNIDQDVIDYAEARAKEYSPVRCYVMDIARTTNGLKVIELNTMNSCGFYAADVGKIIDTLEKAYD